MKNFLHKKKELPLEEELYHNAYIADNGLVAFKNVWANKSFTGNIYCLEELLIEEGAEITGEIICKKCHVKGKVKGRIDAWEMLTIDEHACVTGNVTSKRIEAAPGSVINGRVRMNDQLSIPDYVAGLTPFNLKKYEADVTAVAPVAVQIAKKEQAVPMARVEISMLTPGAKPEKIVPRVIIAEPVLTPVPKPVEEKSVPIIAAPVVKPEQAAAKPVLAKQLFTPAHKPAAEKPAPVAVAVDFEEMFPPATKKESRNAVTSKPEPALVEEETSHWW